MSEIRLNSFVQGAFSINGALVAEGTGDGSPDVVFPLLKNIAQSQITAVFIGNTLHRFNGDNPELIGYDASTGTITDIDDVANNLPCVAFYNPI